MTEWPIVHAWKACVRVTVPGVRISLSPHITRYTFIKIIVGLLYTLFFLESDLPKYSIVTHEVFFQYQKASENTLI